MLKRFGFSKSFTLVDSFLLCALLLFCCAYSFFTVYNTDFGFSLRMGEYLREHLEIPDQTIFLDQKETRYNPDDKWLFHILFSLVFDTSQWLGLHGFTGLILFRIFLVCCSFLFLYFTLKKQLPPFPSFLLCLFAIIGTSEQFMIRATLLSITLLCFHLYLYTQKLTKIHFSILGITLWFWANCHSFFVLGQALFLWWSIVELFWKPKSSYSPKFIGLTLFCCFFIPLLNPFGFGVYQFPLKILENLFSQSQFYANTLSELVSPLAHEDFPTWGIKVFKLYLVFGILCLFFNIRCIKNKGFALSAGWFLGFLVLPFLARKNIGVFIPIATAFLAHSFSSWEGLKKYTFLKKLNLYGACLFIPFYFYLLWMPLSNTLYLQEQRQQRAQLGIAEMIFPEKAVDFLLEYKLPKPLFNNYEIGTYLIYRCFPHTSYRPFILTDYGSGGLKLVQYYQKVLRGEISLSTLYQEYKIETFILKHTSPNTQLLIPQLFQSPEYQWVYLDPISIIFVRTSSLKKHHYPQKNYLTQSLDVSPAFPWSKEIPWKKFSVANFYQLLNTPESRLKAKILYEDCLSTSPNYPKALLNLASLEASKGDMEGIQQAILLLNDLRKKYPAYSQPEKLRKQLKQNLEDKLLEKNLSPELRDWLRKQLMDLAQ